MILTTIGHLYKTVGTRTFGFTGSLQTWVVPDGVTSISANVIGALGGTIQAYRGGYGANLTATIPVTPGQTLYLVVGESGMGKSYSNKPTPTYGGGGVGGGRHVKEPTAHRSDVQQQSTHHPKVSRWLSYIVRRRALACRVQGTSEGSSKWARVGTSAPRWGVVSGL